MALYDLGYGLGKMGEGLSSGLLQGTMTGINLQMQKRKEDQALGIAAAKEAGLERRHTEDITQRQDVEKRQVAEAQVTKALKAIELGTKIYEITGDKDKANEAIKNLYGTPGEGEVIPILDFNVKPGDWHVATFGENDIFYNNQILNDIIGKVPAGKKAEAVMGAIQQGLIPSAKHTVTETLSGQQSTFIKAMNEQGGLEKLTPEQKNQGVALGALIKDAATGKIYEKGTRLTTENVPSAGNAVDLAIKRKFGSDYLRDPLKSKEADKWLDTGEGRKAVQEARDDLTPPTIGIIQTGEGIKTIGTRGKGMGEIKETGEAPPLSEDFKKDYTAIGQANDLVTSLKTTWDSLKISSGTLGRTEGTAAYLSGKTGQNPDAKVYLDTREAFLGNLSRSLAAERGVLTTADIERIAKAIPRIGLNSLNNDNKEEAEKKWASIFVLIENAEKRMGERAKMRTEKPSPIKSTDSLELTPQEESYAKEQFKKRGIGAKDQIADEIIKMRGK